MKRKYRYCYGTVLLLWGIFLVPLAAYNPPAGSEEAHTFFSPALLGGQSSSAGTALDPVVPPALSINPALSAGEQRPIFHAAYAGVSNFRSPQPFGHFAAVSGLYPARWGVISASINFFKSDFSTFSLGTAVEGRFSYAKDITDNIYLGIGMYVLGGTGWGLGVDLGFLYNFGDLGFLKNARLGVSLTGLGKPYTPTQAAAQGITSGKVGGFPSPVTPHIGFAATLVDIPHFELGANIDLSAPFFQNLQIGTGLQMFIGELVSVKTGWQFNLVETLKKKPMYLPSVSIGFVIPVEIKQKEGTPQKTLPGRSDIIIDIGAKPFYSDLWALGGGVLVKFGQVDSTPPEITLDYPRTQYISPNSDGVQDILEVPMSITDERDVVRWECTIQNEKEETVRKIENKRALVELQDAASFWKLLTRVKRGVVIPPALSWDGTLDTGEVAPDGAYQFFFTAVDDNGNTRVTDRYTVIVDNTPPEVSLSLPNKGSLIFSPDGDGNKDNFILPLKGSLEDNWNIRIQNQDGTTVYTQTLKDAVPSLFTWNGGNMDGTVVLDGVYQYEISACDRAGNIGYENVRNIIVDTIQPEVSLVIDSTAFSPNGDGVKDELILSPSLSTTGGLEKSYIVIKNIDHTEQVRLSVNPALANIAFNGKDTEDRLLEDGNYTAELFAEYTNGYIARAESAPFLIDTTSPQARVRTNTKIFSPDGDGKIDTAVFLHELSVDDRWTAKIYRKKNGDAFGTAVKTVKLYGGLRESFVWDGYNNSGELAEDGHYIYRLFAVDAAGNKGESNAISVELNTEKADVILSADTYAFSPNGDGIKDRVTLQTRIRAVTPVARYELAVKDTSGNAVYYAAKEGMPPQFVAWDGYIKNSAGRTQCPDGDYSAVIRVELENGQSAQSKIPLITLDTVYPMIAVSVPYVLFSGTADAKRSVLPVHQKSSEEKLWQGSIKNAKGQTVKTMTWENAALPFEWNARDDNGNTVPDGRYRYEVYSEDRAGNKTIKTITNIQLDSRVPKAYIIAAVSAFSPNGDGIQETQQLALATSLTVGITDWNISIQNTDNTVVRRWSSEKGGKKALPSSMIWDGKNDAGNTVQGRFNAVLSITYEKGDVVHEETLPFVSVTQPPLLSARLSPKYFSPDNDGLDDELRIQLAAQSLAPLVSWKLEIREPDSSGGKLFWKTGGTDKIAEKIVWDGRSLTGETVQSATDYPYTFTVTDSVGITTVLRGYVPVDVLVIREGDRLKIAVPSIIFRKNAADFNALDKGIVDKNYLVLKRIAEILNKFPEYRIQVEGHANNVSGTEQEESRDLIPLSNARADAVRKILIENNVRANRLTSVGVGGTRPVVGRDDRDNWWKNRRVEFILIK